MFDLIKRKAFTLTELLIALGVIGILTAVLMPIIFNLMPDQNTIMAKRAFYTAESVISDLINDQDCYPQQLARAGFDDGASYKRCDGWGEEHKDQDDAKTKFITLFTKRLDIKRGTLNNSGGKTTFETKDGMFWTLTNFGFTANNPDSYMFITVDVNGQNKKPNCGQSNTAGKCKSTKKKNGFDTFAMRVFARGRIQLIDCWAIKAGKIDKKIVGKEDAVNCEVTGNGNDEDECPNAPTNADDYCCNNDKWRNSAVCNPCVVEPQDPDDYCCSSESNSSWVDTEACDPCTYTRPTGPDDACCQEGHKWFGSDRCSVCADPYSVDCCMTKKNSIEFGDKCCEHSQIKSVVSACNKVPLIINSRFYVSSKYPKDKENWDQVKIDYAASIDAPVAFDIDIHIVRACTEANVGCGTYNAGITCHIPAGSRTCNANEEFVTGKFLYKFEIFSITPEQTDCGITGFQASYAIPADYESQYFVKIKFPDGIEQYE